MPLQLTSASLLNSIRVTPHNARALEPPVGSALSEQGCLKTLGSSRSKGLVSPLLGVT